MIHVKKQAKRLNLQLAQGVDEMLRAIASKTGLKLVTIISKGIEEQHRKMEEGK